MKANLAKTILSTSSPVAGSIDSEIEMRDLKGIFQLN
jgi:hypothetical protein